MSSLNLHFTETTLLLLTQQAGDVQMTALLLENDKPFARERRSAPIKEALQNTVLQNCLWFGPDYTLFPRVLFDQNQLEAYYSLNQGQIAAQRHLQYQVIAALDLVLIYSIPVWLYDSAKYELQAVVKHSVGQLLNFVAQQHYQDRVVLLLEANHFVLLTIKNRQLLSCTANEYQQSTDIFYFLLAQQQKLQLASAVQLDIYAATPFFDFETFEQTMAQFKDFEQYLCAFYASNIYQNTILCASFEDH
jgi:hypothetical protein